MKKTRYIITSSALALLLTASLIAAPIVVRINDVPGRAPVVQVHGAPNGYDLYTGTDVADPDIEEGGLITLFGVNNFYDWLNGDIPSLIPDLGWRFVDPNLPPDTLRNAVDIVWIQHDYFGPFFSGDLQVGFDSAFPGIYYRNPDFNSDENAGPVTSNWVTLYSDETIEVQFKPHTYRLRD